MYYRNTGNIIDILERRKVMIVAYKYRMYPNAEQKELIDKTLHCSRFVYNKTLRYRMDIYNNEKRSLTKFDCNNYCNQVLKKEYPGLKEVDRFALVNAVFNMDSAYRKFLKKKTNFPKFKPDSDFGSYKTNFNTGNIGVDFKNNKAKLPKLKLVKVKFHRCFKGDIKSAMITKKNSGNYYVSFLVETELEKRPHTKKNVGIDLGIKDLCIDSDGNKYENDRIYERYQKKLAKLQRQLAHKTIGSSNYKKKKQEVAKCHEKIANCRADYQHKLSHKFITENQLIVTENLDVLHLVQKNKYLSKNIMDASWYEFINKLYYKSKWYDRKFIRIDRYYPSSQICSKCGYKNEELKNFSIRKWRCPVCGAEHDRDINAAKNILIEGLNQIK